VSLSDKERDFLPTLNYVATVPNGIRTDQIRVGDGGGGYLAFVGRIAPEKAPDLAIEAARAAGATLRIAGRIEDRHDDFAAAVLSATGGGVDYVGELSRAEVMDFLAGARALLMPLRWDEPFGLVVAESLACGTPVVAWRRGSMPEIVDDATTGFLVDDIAGAASALGRIGELSRDVCRAAAESRFDARVMAAAYLRVYETVLSPSRRRGLRPSPPRP
jgi:glycosyltransferase involved in cell wall biosynthesis